MIKKPKSDPPGCTVDIIALQDALDILGGKWKLLILNYLLLREDQNNTFKKIEKDMDGISAKVLSNELKILESHQLVSREVMDTKPIAVRYSITEYGRNSKEVIDSLVTWGLKHRMKIMESPTE